jgi:hypothetical protein
VAPGGGDRNAAASQEQPMHRVWKILLAPLPSSQEDALQQLAEPFHQAKGLSDFVGIIVSMTFTMAFCIFSFDKISTKTFGFEAAGYANVALASAILACYFFLLITRMIFLYLFQDVRSELPLWYRIVFGLISMVTYFSLLTGIWNVAIALAKLGKCA